MKDITFSAPDELIRKSREYAKKHGTTLNQMIRDFLGNIGAEPNDDFKERLDELRKEIKVDTRELKFNREDMYER